MLHGKPRWRVELLRNRTTSEETKVKYQEALKDQLLKWGERVDALVEEASPEEDVVSIAAEMLREAVEEGGNLAIGRTRTKRKAKYWWDMEIQALVESRRAMYALLRNGGSLEELDQYKALRKRVKTMAREKILDSQRALKAKLDENVQDDIKLFWKFAKSQVNDIGDESGPPTALRQKDGSISETPESLAKILREHYQSLGNAPGDETFFDEEHKREVDREVDMIAAQEDSLVGDEVTSAEEDPLNGKVNIEEVRRELKSLKNGKSGGTDGIVNELLKNGGAMMSQGLTELFNLVWKRVKVPENWWMGVTVSLFKKGDRLDSNNYRGITLLNVIGKLFCRVMTARLKEVVKLHEEQGGFRELRGPEDQLFIVADLMFKKKTTGKPLYMAFLDVRKAYDRVWRNGLWKKLWDSGIRGRMWKMLRSLYEKVTNKALAGGVVSETYELLLGLKQGCVLSPLLFDVFVDDLVTEVNAANAGVMIGASMISLLLFADDIVLLAESAEDLQRSLDTVEGWCRKWRLELNTEKSEVMVVNGAFESDILYNGVALKAVSKFCYLGLMLNKDCNWNDAVERATTKVNGVTARLSRILHLKLLSARSKVLIWNTLARPTMEHAAATWWADKKQTDKMEAAQLKALRAVLGCKVGVDALVIRSELGVTSMRSRLDSHKLKYIGRIACMPKERLTKQMLEYSPPDASISRRRGWRVIVDKALEEYDLREEFERLQESRREEGGEEQFNVNMYKAWKRNVEKAVLKTENERFGKACEEKRSGRGKLEYYRCVKTSIYFEEYLNDTNHWKSAKLKFLLRSGSLSLEVESGRRSRRERGDRVCGVCGRAEVEDELHFIFRCIALRDLRDKLGRNLRKVLVRESGHSGCVWEEFWSMSEREKLLVLLGGTRPGWSVELLMRVDLVFRQWLLAAWERRSLIRSANCNPGPVEGSPESMDPGWSLARL